MDTKLLLSILVSFLAGAGISFLLLNLRLKSAKRTAKDIIRDARREIEREKNKIIIKAKEDWFKIRDEQESKLRAKVAEVEEMESQFLEREKKLNRREEILKQREGLVSQKEHDLKSIREALHAKEKELSRIIKEQDQELC
ncbi:MAG: DUF3552 domain-containing protein, partial [Calditrichaeota bacterium]